jgi:hypothetical protein
MKTRLLMPRNSSGRVLILLGLYRRIRPNDIQLRSEKMGSYKHRVAEKRIDRYGTNGTDQKVGQGQDLIPGFEMPFSVLLKARFLSI